MIIKNTTAQRDPPGAYLPGLDGLRAIAVVAVLIYHAGLQLPGGFLGVESFFVISGFLITALLSLEWERAGKIDLPAFWLRRARRLLPALAVFLAGTLVLAALLLPSETSGLGRESLAALGYVTNWYFIVRQQSYFDALSRPSLLQHLWSLAVEEQFYLVWPLLFALGARRLRPAGLLTGIVALAIASAALGMLLYQPGDDPSRVYYGTDTRVAGLLVGAALAVLWIPRRSALGESRAQSIAADLIGLAALGGLVSAYIWLWAEHPLLYFGGFQLVALMTAAIILAATHPRTRLVPGLLELPPMRWVGARSYSLYLWHWPIFLLTRPGIDIPYTGWPVEIARFGLVCGAAALSYRFVEQPVRRHGFAGIFTVVHTSAAQRAFSVAQQWQRQPRVQRWLLAALLVLSTSSAASVLSRPTRAAPLPARLAAAGPALPTARPSPAPAQPGASTPPIASTEAPAETSPANPGQKSARRPPKPQPWRPGRRSILS